MGYNKRDSKDGMPTADNVYRQNEAGNVPVTGEKHNQKKSSKIGSDSNRTTGPTAMAVDQPTRSGEAGNTPVSSQVETHDSKKAMKISESARW